jgi:hypothetical protein
MPEKYNPAILNATGNKVVELADAGAGPAVLTIYNGTQPATGGGAPTGCTALAVFQLGDPMAPAAVNGIVTVNAIPAVLPAAIGTATWARLTDSDGTWVADHTAGVSTGVVRIPAITNLDNSVKITSYIFTQNAA